MIELKSHDDNVFNHLSPYVVHPGWKFIPFNPFTSLHHKNRYIKCIQLYIYTIYFYWGCLLFICYCVGLSEQQDSILSSSFLLCIHFIHSCVSKTVTLSAFHFSSLLPSISLHQGKTVLRTHWAGKWWGRTSAPCPSRELLCLCLHSSSSTSSSANQGKKMTVSNCYHQTNVLGFFLFCFVLPFPSVRYMLLLLFLQVESMQIVFL